MAKYQHMRRLDMTKYAHVVMMMFAGLLICTGPVAAEEPQVQRQDGQLVVTLPEQVQLRFALEDDLLLGLNRASVQDVELTSAQTVQRPMLAQEWGKDRMVWPLLRLKDVAVDGKTVRIETELLGTTDEQVMRDVFVFTKEGQIHRDYYRFAHLRLPAEVCQLSFVRQQAKRLADKLKPAGTLTWVIRPDQRTIAGWPYAGWKQHVEVHLADGRKVNVFRQAGTWELGGEAAGATLVNLRYRGLGKLEQPLSADPDGGVKEAFSTTEIMPGAVGDAPAVSPVVPSGESVTDRGYGLRHRVGAWIARMARGAGHGFVDFQYRPEAILCSFYEKQGNLRALTEVFPEDRQVSQTDEEFFANTDRFRTQDQVYLALVTEDNPLATHDSRTRWKEVDQYVRDLVAEELDFVQREVVPGIGILYDGGWAKFYRDLADSGVANYAAQGVQKIVVHNPGLINGRYQGPGGPPKTGGGVCNIYDWRPTEDMKEPWKAFTKACAENDVIYYPWWNVVIWKDGPFADELGLDRKHYCINAPGDFHGGGWSAPAQPTDRPKLVINPFDKRAFLTWWDRLAEAQNAYGLQGVWIDSFQNNTMTHLDWANGTGNSTQREWWEAFAALSRRGVALMGESNAFPGQSCSIEVHGWEQQPWLFQHVWKWLRGNDQKDWSKEKWNTVAFEVMANKGWVAPDCSYNRPIPERFATFERYAKEYSAALPDMRRSYILPEAGGVLWLPYSGDTTGVWFSFSKQALPSGVEASYILDEKGAAIGEVTAQRTYRVKGKDLLKAFDVRRGSLADPRIGRKHRQPKYVWPKWASATEKKTSDEAKE
ncbi:MAG: hypothetical protein ACLFV7_10145 [Phycisphaerae bacterium]